MAKKDVPKEKLVVVVEGSSGTENFSGYITEEFLQKLQGSEGAKVYDKMRRSDYQVRMALNSVKNPLKSATWSIEPFDDSEDAQHYANFIEYCLFEGMDTTFDEWLSEALSFIEFGFSVFEKQHKVVLDHPEFGSYIGFKKLHFRSQKTIERWNVDPKDESLVSVTQQAFGDGQKSVDIPAKNLVTFHWEKEGNNFEGISMLRACYGPYFRKDVFLKLLAIGIEKYSVPTPVGTAAQGQGPGSEEFAQFKLALRKYLTHQEQYLILPHGWEVELKSSDFDPEKTRKAIDAEDRAITKAFLANFLELGINSSNGSKAASTDLSDFFLSGLKQIGALVVSKFNRELIPELMRLNFGNVKEMPYMRISGIDDTVGIEFSQAIKNLVDGKIVTPDERLEEYVRERFGLPEIDKDTQRVLEAAPQFPGVGEPKAEVAPEVEVEDEAEVEDLELSEIALAEKTARAQIKEASDNLKKLMGEQLRAMSKTVIRQITDDFANASKTRRVAAVLGKSIKGKTKYQDLLRQELAKTSAEALKNVRAEAKGKVNLADDYYKELAAEVIAQIKVEAELLAATQISDLEKQIFMQFTSSVTSTENAELIAKDLEEAVNKYAEGPSVVAAAGNSTAKIINDTRNAYFFEPEVLAEIKSFTFMNPNPKAEVCKNLAGRTFAKDDPEAARYFPPLHHNCNSYIKANYVEKPIDPRGLNPTTEAAFKSISLSK